MPALTRNPDGTPHIHAYKRKPNTETYLCLHPLCTHSRHRSELFGKMTLCSKCQKNSFILQWRHLRMAGPLCEECSNTDSAKLKRARRQTLAELFPGTPEQNTSTN